MQPHSKEHRTVPGGIIGGIILAAAIIWSATTVFINNLRHNRPNITTIRICHWQLEAGFRESLQQLINDYQTNYEKRTGHKVQIVQTPISERAYRQYINTGLIGGMAPDIIELGKAKTTEDPSYIVRFFMPLGSIISHPNPYNKDTPLENTPWRDTFLDGLQGDYKKDLLDYYSIPYSFFTIRIYYNKKLYSKIIGHSNPPNSFAEFMEVCTRIKKYATENRLPLVPVATSRAQAAYFSKKYNLPFRIGLAEKCDMDFDGNTTYFESYFAMRRGLWDFNSPALMANSRCMAEIAANFPPGWLAIQRDDALFMFVQQRAVMIAAGSWDAQGIITQTRDSFDIGIFGFPMPTDHPVYGKFVHGPASEAASRGGIPWAINKHSPHTDICIDFLQFSTTAAANSDFNNRLTWLPIIRGARIYNERLRKFQPILHGYTGFFDYKISSAITIMERGNLWSLYAGQLSPEKNAEQMQKIYDRTASSGFTKKLDSLRRANRNLDRVITANIALRQVHQKKHTTTRKLILLNKASQSVAHKVAIYQKLFQNSNSQTTLSPPP